MANNILRGENWVDFDITAYATKTGTISWSEMTVVAVEIQRRAIDEIRQLRRNTPQMASTSTATASTSTATASTSTATASTSTATASTTTALTLTMMKEFLENCSDEDLVDNPDFHDLAQYVTARMIQFLRDGTSKKRKNDEIEE